MMRWLLDRPFGVFDLETTSADPEAARIVSGCFAMLLPGSRQWQQDIETVLVAVDEDIPESATAIHGITTDFARAHGIVPMAAVELLANALAESIIGHLPIVGMNLAYDLTVLDRECRRLDLPTADERTGRYDRIVDIYVIDKWVDPYRPGKRTLGDLVNYYGVSHDGAHDATADALAAGRVAYRMAWLAAHDHDVLMAGYERNGRRDAAEIADRWGLLGGMSPQKLHSNQASWRDTQQRSLGDYLRRRAEAGAPVTVDIHWPVRPYQRTFEEETADVN